MGPGGWANWGSPPVQYMGGQVGLFDRLTLEEVGHLIVGVGFRIIRLPAIGFSLLHWNYHVFKDQTDWLEFDTWFPPSPGGGGPGQSLTSTNPPPSVEEVGDLLNEVAPSLIYAPRGVPYRTRRQNGKRCPPGYRWDKKRRKCVKLKSGYMNYISR